MGITTAYFCDKCHKEMLESELKAEWVSLWQGHYIRIEFNDGEEYCFKCRKETAIEILKAVSKGLTREE